MTTILMFLLGGLLGLCVGAIVCVRQVRQELTGCIAPSLANLNQDVGSVQRSVTLMQAEIALQTEAQRALALRPAPFDAVGGRDRRV